VKRSTLFKKILVFSTVFTLGIVFLYSIHFIWVISVLILLGISLGISGIPSERIAPYPADAAVHYTQKFKRLFRKSDSGKFQKI
jgi:hypothetical protein